MRLDLLGLQIDSPLAHPEAQNFRPPSMPPPADWAPIIDAHGVAQCLYSDSVWPLDVWAGKPLSLNFGDGLTKGRRIDKANADLLRACTTWWIFGSRGCRSPHTLKGKHTNIKPIFAVCSEEGIEAGNLMRYPRVIEKVAKSLSSSNFDNAITVLHELLSARKELGFCILDKDGIRRLASLAPSHDSEQTPYIPPRIWLYMVERLRECLIEYLAHREQVEACYAFCLDAYATNYGALKQAINAKSHNNTMPFQNREKNKRKGCTYHGSFKATADHFGVTPLIERWVRPFTGEKGERQLPMLSQYLDVVSKAGLAYLVNFSLMRIEEAWKLRSDCLLEESDEKFGKIHLLCGETTKTDPDSDARWPVSESAKLAVEAMKHIAGMRMRCARESDNIGLTKEDQANPYLISYQYEPWSLGRRKSYQIRPAASNLDRIIKAYPLLLDAKDITITEQDLSIARLIEPTLDPAKFKVGSLWTFGWHQLRRTGAVNMLSSSLVDESSLQFILKHTSRVMTLYYGRNHSHLNLNQETRTKFLKTMYQEFGRELGNLQQPQFVSPLGPERKEDIVVFIKEADAVSLDKAARQGKIGARRIRAGFCVKNRSCPYGGHEAIAHCLGSDIGKGCPDLLIDITKESDIRAYEAMIDEQLTVVHQDSPRYKRLQAEKIAIGKYDEIVARQAR